MLQMTWLSGMLFYSREDAAALIAQDRPGLPDAKAQSFAFHCAELDWARALMQRHFGASISRLFTGC